MVVISANVPPGTLIGTILGTTVNLTANATATASGTAARLSAIGDSQGLGQVGGAYAHTLIQLEMPSHVHSITDPGHSHTLPIGNSAANVAFTGGGTVA
jgi:hypothetical protein